MNIASPESTYTYENTDRIKKKSSFLIKQPLSFAIHCFFQVLSNPQVTDKFPLEVRRNY